VNRADLYKIKQIDFIKMKTSFKSFMNKLIDYAGLFPPAKLPMNASVRNFNKYQTGNHSWMLSRFICPVPRLRELDVYHRSLINRENHWNLSALGRGGNETKGFMEGLLQDLEDIAEFIRFHKGAAVIDAFEVRLPGELFEKPDIERIQDFLGQSANLFENNISNEIISFYESGLLENWNDARRTFINAIAGHNQLIFDNNYKKYGMAGFKLRCGGVKPSMYPSVEQVASAIHTCKNRKIPFKATAGLHHPIRHFNKNAGVNMHGFINVFGAGVLSHCHDLELGVIEEIVAEENPSNFRFDESAFSWQDYLATAEQIEEIRSKYMISFGSCSFDEPLEDLTSLGLMN
jgi:hypothetical protein